MNSEIISSLFMIMILLVSEPALISSALYLKKKDIIKGSDFNRLGRKYLKALAVTDFVIFILFTYRLFAAFQLINIPVILFLLLAATGFAIHRDYAFKYFINEFFGKVADEEAVEKEVNPALQNY